MRILFHRTRRPSLYILLVFAACILLDLFRYFSLHKPLSRDTLSSLTSNGTLYIASTHWNTGHVLRNHWNKQIVQIVELFGSHNVYVSVYESGSWDASKGALQELDNELTRLDVPHKIILDPTTHLDEVSKAPTQAGWIDTPRGKKELRRIPYLSKLRNFSIQPLLDFYENGTSFDTILFLNDVVFDIHDVTTLLATNHGTYAAACSLDFSKASSMYDTFATRDSEGHEALMSRWPYFRSRKSRHDLVAQRPVKVRSCWGGMAAMKPTPFHESYHPLRFPGIPDSLAKLHIEGSECCLIHQDNLLTQRDGAWINPDVRVGYNKAAYDAMRIADFPRSFFVYMIRIWENRLRRWVTKDWIKRQIVLSRLSRWKNSSNSGDREEISSGCLIDEMQVLVPNGWAHL